MSTTPLAGLKVLDLSKVLAGPMCAQYLGDMGASVIKIETPDFGDETRYMPPFMRDATGVDTGAIFLSVNRNKQSLAVDAQSDAGRDLVLRLADQSDVVIESFGPGVSKRLGIDGATMRARNAALIHCSISGFGSVGPMREGKGYDVILQAFCGMMSITGDPDGPPVRCPFSPVDQATGLHALIGILALLHERTSTGIGGTIEASLFDTGAAFMSYTLQSYWLRGIEPKRSATGHESLCPYQAFDTADKPIMLGVANDGLWRRFCNITDLDHIVSDPRFSSNAARVANRADTVAIVGQVLVRHGRDHWLDALDKAGIPSGPIHSIAEFAAHPHLAASGMISEQDDIRFGTQQNIAQPLRFDGNRTAQRSPPPSHGADGRAVLAAAGFSGDEIEALGAAGVIKLPQTP